MTLQEQLPETHAPSRVKWMLIGACAIAGLAILAVVAFIVLRRVPALSMSTALGPQVPVTITFREALLSRGAVAQVNNYSNMPLDQVIIKCANASLNKSHEFHFRVLEARRSIKIGWREGWDFTPGDTVTVQSPGYSAITVILGK